MALREVLVDGKRWAVWDVRASAATRKTGQRSYSELLVGWLAMQSGKTARRLTPIPDDWEDWPDEILAVAVRSASPARRVI